MRTKENKLNYQKVRVIVVCAFLLVNFVFELAVGFIWGASDQLIMLKYGQSTTCYLWLVAIVVFRQRYELQIGQKHDVQVLCVGKSLFLLVLGVIYMTTMWPVNTIYQTVVNLIFLGAFILFFTDNIIDNFIPEELEGMQPKKSYQELTKRVKQFGNESFEFMSKISYLFNE